jgi:hypothetical protein
MAHGNRGRAPSNKTDTSTRALVLTLSQEKYSSFNDAHFTEMSPPVLKSPKTPTRIPQHGCSIG